MFHFFIISFVSITTSLAFASSNPNSRAMDAYIESARLEQTLDESYQKMAEAMIQQNPTDKDLANDYLQFLRDNVSFKSLESEIRMIYADKFSETELYELAAFNHSPVGKKLIALSPSIGTEVMIASQAKLNKKLPLFLKSRAEKKKIQK